MNKLEIKDNMFGSIKHIDENGVEYWLARELMTLLEYNKWENFHKLIKQAMMSCIVVIILLLTFFLRSGKWLI